jgi:hypothetical protein
MTRNSPTTSQRRLNPEARGRRFAEIAAECSVGIFPGDYSEAAISDFAAEMGKLFAKWDAEDARSKRTERKPPKPRRPSIRTMIAQAEKATGKPLASITLADGTKLDFGKSESTDPNPWLDDLNKVTKQ